MTTSEVLRLTVPIRLALAYAKEPNGAVANMGRVLHDAIKAALSKVDEFKGDPDGFVATWDDDGDLVIEWILEDRRVMWMIQRDEACWTYMAKAGESLSYQTGRIGEPSTFALVTAAAAGMERIGT